MTNNTISLAEVILLRDDAFSIYKEALELWCEKTTDTTLSEYVLRSMKSRTTYLNGRYEALEMVVQEMTVFKKDVKPKKKKLQLEQVRQ